MESFTDPERDPLQAALFENPPRIVADGWLTLNDVPGLGLTVADAALAKFKQRLFTRRSDRPCVPGRRQIGQPDEAIT